MSMYYVAALARYVLVEAESEAQARELGLPALRELYAADGTDARFVQIRTVRLATEDELEFERDHRRMLADYLGCKRSGDESIQVSPLNAPRLRVRAFCRW